MNIPIARYLSPRVLVLDLVCTAGRPQDHGLPPIRPYRLPPTVSSARSSHGMFSRSFLSVRGRAGAQLSLVVHVSAAPGRPRGGGYEPPPSIRRRALHQLVGGRASRRELPRLLLQQQSDLGAPLLTASFLRHASGSADGASSAQEGDAARTTDTTDIADAIPQIPEPPAPLVSDIVEAVAKEPTLQDLGIGSNYPHGLLQQLLEFIHTQVGLPWWGTIVCTTVCFRILLFPIVIRIQRAMAKMNNVQPQFQYIQQQLTDARKMGDRMEVARLTHEMYTFMKEKGISPLQNALPLVQAPIFLSFFWGLRGMVQAPVESMKEGGLWWFTNLTVPDPYYILPLITSATLYVTIEVGADTVRADSLGMMKYVLRAAPIIMFPFIMNFEGAILCYWVSTNLFSLVQVSVLRIPKVRTYFNIPALVKHDKKKLPVANKKFVEGFKDTWTNMKVARELSTREMYDEIVFEKAGKGPVPKTYKHDPTKSYPVPNAILSKKRD